MLHLNSVLIDFEKESENEKKNLQSTIHLLARLAIVAWITKSQFYLVRKGRNGVDRVANFYIDTYLTCNVTRIAYTHKAPLQT